MLQSGAASRSLPKLVNVSYSAMDHERCMYPWMPCGEVCHQIQRCGCTLPHFRLPQSETTASAANGRRRRSFIVSPILVSSAVSSMVSSTPQGPRRAQRPAEGAAHMAGGELGRGQIPRRRGSADGRHPGQGAHAVHLSLAVMFCRTANMCALHPKAEAKLFTVWHADRHYMFTLLHYYYIQGSAAFANAYLRHQACSS